MKKCKNCGYKFDKGNVIPTRGVKHPNAYHNPYNPIPWTPYISEVCPKCDSDAIDDDE